MPKTAKNIIIISSRIQRNTGGGVINQRNIDILKQISPDTKVFYIDAQSSEAQSGILTKVVERLCGIFGGLSRGYLAQIKTRLLNVQPSVVFINQSLYGAVAKLTKQLFPTAKVITFFHNAEALYFDSLCQTKPLHLGVQLNRISSRKAEKMAIDKSDYLICMNHRDSNALVKLYGRSADLLLPTSFNDKGAVNYCQSEENEPLRLLFVGYNFFANLHGLNWFCQEVMPQISNVHLTVVGRDMELERSRLQTENISIIGSVDDLAEYYSKADIIVSPIFIGSGMKTKTAEALMYGLPLLATSEALEGYDIDPSKVGARCDNAISFIDRLNFFTTHRDELPELSRNSRHYFETLYSQDIAVKKLQNFFNQI